MMIIAGVLVAVAVAGVGAIGGVTYLSYRGVTHLAGKNGRGSSLPHSVKRSIQEANEAGRAIRATIRQCPPGPIRDRLSVLAVPVGDWLATLDRLQRGLINSYAQYNVPRETRKTQGQIASLTQQLLSATPEQRETLTSLLASKKQHLIVLEELKGFQDRVALRIRKIGADLSAIQAEIVLAMSKGSINEQRLERLDQSLREQSHTVRDMLDAMDEMAADRELAR